MINPSTSRAECNYHAGLVNQDGMNQPQTSNRESYNTFDKSHLVADTQLFSQVRPCYMDAGVSGDVKSIDMKNNLWSPTLKSQLLTSVKMHRSFYQVPWSVIMPNTWDYLIRQPVKGEDIDFSSVGPIIQIGPSSDNLHFSLYDFCRGIYSFVSANYLGTSVITLPNALKCLFVYVSLTHLMFGQSSLPRTLGVRIVDFGKVYEGGFDPDQVYSNFLDYVLSLSDSDAFDTPLTSIQYNFSDGSLMSFDVSSASAGELFNFFNDFLQYGDFESLSFVFQGTPSVTGDSFKTSVSDMFMSHPDYYLPLNAVPGTETFNLMPLIAYQCIWHQFYTNDRIDDVYSAKMWQDNMLSLLYGSVDGSVVSGLSFTHSFTINGTSVPYDAYSSYCLSFFISSLVDDGDSENLYAYISYVLDLFLVRPSMRYSDYFTSMRTQPLAVGDVGVQVNNNIASAIDINSSLWMQRYVNAVNRTKQSIYDYLQDMTGVLPARRAPQPNFIMSETYNVGGIEIENTADNQGNIVTLLRNTQSNSMYEIFIDEPSYIIGVDSFSMSYMYPDSCHKVAEMNDRLDWFNSFMQHTGDQAVDMRELITPPNSLEYWNNAVGYQLRYSQFKYLVSRCCGGFNGKDTTLDSWIARYDPIRAIGEEGSPSQYGAQYHISSFFIRNHDSDFDKFYSSLTGTNYCNRWHFIKLISFNERDNSKQQAYPSLM